MCEFIVPFSRVFVYLVLCLYLSTLKKTVRTLFKVVSYNYKTANINMFIKYNIQIYAVAHLSK